jgi:hypothetical protein
LADQGLESFFAAQSHPFAGAANRCANDALSNFGVIDFNLRQAIQGNC